MHSDFLYGKKEANDFRDTKTWPSPIHIKYINNTLLWTWQNSNSAFLCHETSNGFRNE